MTTHSDNHAPHNMEGVQLALWNLAVLTPIPAIAAWMIGNAVLGIAVVSFVLCAATFAVALKLPALAKPAVAFALLIQTMVLTAAFQGHPWQIDTHMMYFAVLAVIAVMYDIRVLIGSAAFIALHHLGMSVAMPMMLYPDMADGFIARTLLHAAVVVMETVILTLGLLQRREMDRAMATQREAIEASSEASRAAEEAAEGERRSADTAVEVLSMHLQALSQQDFSRMIEERLDGQYDRARQSFNNLVISLRDVLRTAAETSSDYNISARELSDVADELAKRTMRQSDTLSETAGGLQDLTRALQDTAEGAKKANETASQARDSAARNGDIVRNAVEAMKRIEGSSGEISNIISMIEDISFQTNLLALNAGVEAARAGESGRGFAVVASEVRALAQRTSEAAQSVKQLIFKSSQEVEAGSDLVNAAGEALSVIVEQVSQTSEMIGEITQSVSGQAGVSRDLNDAVQSLDRATQENAQMCDRMKSMGHQLNAGAAELSGALSGFQFGDRNDIRLAG